MVRSRNLLPEWPLLSLSSSMDPCFLSLLLLLLSATAGGQCHDHWGHHTARHKSATSDAPSTQIRQACKATRFPNVCKSTLSDSDSLPPNPSPFDFILATATASAASLETIRSMIQSILDASEKASNINCTNTARINLEVLSFSDRRLSAAFSTALPIGDLGNAHAWASAALLYQYDCWSGLKYVNDTAQVSDAMAFTSLPSSLWHWHRHWPEFSLTLPFRPVGPNRGPLFDPLGSNRQLSFGPDRSNKGG